MKLVHCPDSIAFGKSTLQRVTPNNGLKIVPNALPSYASVIFCSRSPIVLMVSHMKTHPLLVCPYDILSLAAHTICCGCSDFLTVGASRMTDVPHAIPFSA